MKSKPRSNLGNECCNCNKPIKYGERAMYYLDKDDKLLTLCDSCITKLQPFFEKRRIKNANFR